METPIGVFRKLQTPTAPHPGQALLGAVEVVSILDNPFKIESALDNNYGVFRKLHQPAASPAAPHTGYSISEDQRDGDIQALLGAAEEIITIFDGFHDGLTNRRFCEIEKDHQQNVNNHYLNLSEFSDLLEIDCEEHESMNDDDLKYIANICINLEKINLTNCKNITDVGLEYFLRNCKNLYILNITRCYQIKTIGMEYSGAQESLLGCGPAGIRSDEGADDSIGLLPFLHEINLFGCEKISETSLENMLMRCTNLHTINLGNISQISDITLCNISKYCKNMISLNLSWCWKITDIGLIEILRNIQKIRELNLRNCCNISDNSLKNLRFLHDLEILDLSYNSNITDRSLIILGLGCPNLKNINLINTFQNNQVTKDGIQYLKEKCIKLEKIDLIFIN